MSQLAISCHSPVLATRQFWPFACLATREYSPLTRYRHSPVLGKRHFLPYASFRYSYTHHSRVPATRQFWQLATVGHSPDHAILLFSLLEISLYSPVLTTRQIAPLAKCRNSPFPVTRQFWPLASSGHSLVWPLASTRHSPDIGTLQF